MPLGDHLEELRRRLILAFVGVAPILIVGLIIGRRLLSFLIEPVREALIKQDLAPFLQAVSPIETFANYLKVSLVFTIVLGAPWIVLQLWKFIAPGLYSNERRFAYVLAPLSVVLTALSMVFLYYVILPIMLTFFISFGSSLPSPAPAVLDSTPEMVLPTFPSLDGDPSEPAAGSVWFNSELKQLRIAIASGDGVKILGTPMVTDAAVAQQFRVNEHIKFVLSLALAFAISFQMPVVVLLLGWAGIIEPSLMVKYRRQSVMVLAVISAILTPADPLSMLLLAAPLYMLYEFGLLLLRVMPAKRVSEGFGSSGDSDAS